MKQRAIAFIQSLRFRANCNKRRLLLLVLAVLLAPPAARAAGIGDILTLIKTITSTIQGAIGGALGGIQTLQNMVNNFRQQIIWPLDQLNQARAFVTSTRAQYGGLMFQIQAIKNNSATLTNPSRLELLFRNGQSGSISQFQPFYTNVYGTVPSLTDGRLLQRNMIDMDDALAQGSLKTTVLSDQTTQGMLALADSIEQQSATAAPGSAPMLATQAGISELESQAYLEKVLASELRQEAAKLAHQNSLLKQSATSTRNLMNQAQQVLTHP
ncbi:MAG TPA: hypothetical protein VJQ54_15050 [Candidatus Sulfotelmatobacter sp.]|nr:hypothetical protein [Candidatus Sulfotelmatobacter sp.]